MIKDLLLTLTMTDGDDTALAYAMNLANQYNAHLSVVVPFIYPIMDSTDFGLSTYSLYADLYNDAMNNAKVAVESIQEKLANSTFSHSVQMINSSLWSSSLFSGTVAHAADLCILGGDTRDVRNQAFKDLFVNQLLHTGRPVLYVPKGASIDQSSKRVVLAWKPSREATRAINDAMPLLRDAQFIDLLMIESDSSDHADDAKQASLMAAHLARHGIHARIVVQPASKHSIGQSILNYAKQIDAQLIVSGGYSHSRLREQLLGGVTRELTSHAEIPIFFSH
ncbi:MAG: universal stress protein [Arenimonas sp.]|nr:universal stress protein [Arenimonas sp.]